MQSKLTEAEIQQSGLIQMYQAGYVDGSHRKFKDIKDKMKKAFEHRFIKTIQKGVDDVRRTNATNNARKQN